MSKPERDERPLAEICFARDGLPDSVERERRTRALLAEVGVQTAQDIIDLGCTGLSTKMLSLQSVREIRSNMSGSICGLPCYVPPDRFCLVHNTVGALQLQGNLDGPQQLRHPEGLDVCTRELTDEERKAVGAINRKMFKDTVVAAQDLGLEPVVPSPERPVLVPPQDVLAPSSAPSFKCPEHTTFEVKCRFCLAQAVAEGPFEPESFIRTPNDGQYDGVDLDRLLGDSEIDGVELFVRAARWVRKLTRE